MLAGGLAALGLADSLTAVASRTLSGARVAETFTVTNVTTHDVQLAVGPSNQGFTVAERGKVVFNPDAGILAQYLRIETLTPHQSVTITDTWDVRSNLGGSGAEGPPLSGTFTVTSGLDPSGPSATVTIPANWTSTVARTHLVPPKPARPLPTAVGPHVLLVNPGGPMLKASSG